VYVIVHTGVTTSILSTVRTLRSSLVDFIESDFELLDHLLRLDVLNYRQLASVRRKETVYDRNDALLDLLTTEDQCVRFLHALQGTDQQHVVNFIRQNGGQRQNHFITYMYLSKVAHAQHMHRETKLTVRSHPISFHLLQHVSIACYAERCTSCSKSVRQSVTR